MPLERSEGPHLVQLWAPKHNPNVQNYPAHGVMPVKMNSHEGIRKLKVFWLGDRVEKLAIVFLGDRGFTPIPVLIGNRRILLPLIYPGHNVHLNSHIQFIPDAQYPFKSN